MSTGSNANIAPTESISCAHTYIHRHAHVTTNKHHSGLPPTTTPLLLSPPQQQQTLLLDRRAQPRHAMPNAYICMFVCVRVYVHLDDGPSEAQLRGGHGLRSPPTADQMLISENSGSDKFALFSATLVERPPLTGTKSRRCKRSGSTNKSRPPQTLQSTIKRTVQQS